MRTTLRLLIVTLFVIAGFALSACNADTKPAIEVTETTAMLRASVDGEKGENVAYWFEYRKAGQNGWTRTPLRDPGTFGNAFAGLTISERITGLTPETNYEYRFCSYLTEPYPAGSSQYPICFDDVRGATKQISTFTTLPLPPPPPPPPSCTVTATSAAQARSLVSGAAAGATVCLAVGTYGVIDLKNIDKPINDRVTFTGTGERATRINELQWGPDRRG